MARFHSLCTYTTPTACLALSWVLTTQPPPHFPESKDHIQKCSFHVSTERRVIGDYKTNNFALGKQNNFGPDDLEDSTCFTFADVFLRRK